MSVLTLECPSSRVPAREYAARLVLQTCLGITCAVRPGNRVETLIHAGDPASASLTLSDGLLGVPDGDWLTERSLPSRPLPQWDVRGLVGGAADWRRAVPVLYGTPSSDGAWLEGSGRHLRCRADLLGSAFFMATRYEEHVVTARDEHNRFPAAASLAMQERFLDRPVVDEWAAVLDGLLRTLWPDLQRAARQYQVRPTHDVDRTLQEFAGEHPARQAVQRAWAGRSWQPLVRWARFAGGRPGVDACDQFAFLMDVSEAFGLQSEFYFQGYRTSPAKDAEYRLDDPFVQRTFRRIRERGHRVGIHPGYGAPRAMADIVQRTFVNVRYAAARAGFDQDSWGGRHHYLRWDGAPAWRAWQAAGLDYDSSVGFADHPGFRCGLCREFPVFDVLAGEPLRLRERPLIAMDVTFTSHLGLSGTDTAARVAALAATCRQHGGDFVFLWHNNHLQSDQDREQYRSMVGEIAGRG